MKRKYYCEICDMEFDNEDECERHEETCTTEEKFTCYKCGKTITYNPNDRCDWRKEECHVIDLGRPGYGSGLDGCDVRIQICDDCLIGFIDTLTIEGQEKVLNSGSNTYLPTDVWIRERKGELTDEEYEENHMYSPRQRKAYAERFPMCDKVKIRVYHDGSAGSKCKNNAFGNEYGNCDINIYKECYNCKDFKERPHGQLIPVVDANYGEHTPKHIIDNFEQQYIEYFSNLHSNICGDSDAL